MYEHGQRCRVHANGPLLQVYLPLPLTVCLFPKGTLDLCLRNLVEALVISRVGLLISFHHYQLASYCCDTTMTKSCVGKKSFILLTIYNPSLREAKESVPGRNPGTETLATEECCLLDCSP